MSVYLITISEAIGRFHPVLVHLPIGILLIAVMLQWLAANPKYAISLQVVKLVFLLGIAGALLSIITGFLLSNSGDYEGDTVALHMWLGIFTTALSLLAFVRFTQGRSDSKWISVCVLGFVALTGHFGGSLTHGSDYLTAAWGVEEAQNAVVIKPIADVQQANVYADVVQPLFQSRCNNCHGPQKQKGGLRMDSPEQLLKGGKNGDVITAGNALESELIKRLLLPREHEDHMPPKEKPQLTETQVAILHWWIEQGAPFDKKIADLQQPEKIKPLLASLQEGGGKPEQTPILPEKAAPLADVKAVQALREKGVVILPVVNESNYLAANFVTAGFTNRDASLLLPLKQQLLWVKMNDAPVGDSVLAVLGQCTELMALHLNDTKVTDAGLSQLQSLESLHTLSLVGTAVSMEGLKPLQQLKNLERLYLFGTGVGKEMMPMLKKWFPKAMIDFGGYQTQNLSSDTQVVKGSTK